MVGYQITFYTQQGRAHGLLDIADWLMKKAKELGISGATLSVSQAGYGRDGKYHSAHFFELAEQPLEVTMAVSAEEAEAIFAALNKAGLQVFYVKIPAEFGISGEQ